MWNFFARLRRERNRLAAAIATLALIVILSLAMAPAARARNDQPDAMPTATETVLYSFGVGGSGSSCKSVDDGINPLGSLTYVSATGLLFGATSSTNTQGNGFGTVFQIGLDGSGYMVDHFFAGPKADGSAPQHGSLTLLGDVLYGTTLAGGTNNNGTIFSLNDDGTGYSSPPLFNFPKSATNNVGDMPYSTFSAIDNVLYAMTSAGSLHMWGGYGAVSAAKCALESHIRQLAFELAPLGITANSIRAGVTETPAMRKIPASDGIVAVALRKNPNKRLTTPQDVASCLVALARPETYWLTGNVLNIDGGEEIGS